MDGVAGWFERRGEIPLVPPRGVREYGPLSDDPDRPDDDFSATDIHGVAFALEYCDARGWASTRTIRCFALDPSNPAQIKAYCNVRRMTRAFRVDRIISIASLRTGRILSGDEHVALLAPYMPFAAVDVRTQAMCALQAATKDGVFALLQLAMSNGHLSDRAREIVLDYVKAEGEAAGCALPPVRSVELWIDNLAPPLDAVVTSVNNLLSEKDKFVRLLPRLLKVVRSQDSFAEQEEAVRELIEEVRQHFRRKLMDWPSHLRPRRELHAS
jgi:hypothetical protein